MDIVLSGLLACTILLATLAMLQELFPKGKTNWNRVNVGWNLMWAFFLSTVMVSDFIRTHEKLQEDNKNLAAIYEASEKRADHLFDTLQDVKAELIAAKNKKYKIVIEKVP